MPFSTGYGDVGLVWSGWGGLLWLADRAARRVSASSALAGADQQLLRPRSWPSTISSPLYLVFPVIKLLHELATPPPQGRRGEVHDMGIVLLVLLPVPYVEASPRRRSAPSTGAPMVGAAGMAAELFVAALAFYAGC